MCNKKRKAYVKPTIEIVAIEGNIGLLAGSPGESESTGGVPDHGGELGAPKRDFVFHEYDDEEGKGY